MGWAAAQTGLDRESCRDLACSRFAILVIRRGKNKPTQGCAKANRCQLRPRHWLGRRGFRPHTTNGPLARAADYLASGAYWRSQAIESKEPQGNRWRPGGPDRGK